MAIDPSPEMNPEIQIRRKFGDVRSGEMSIRSTIADSSDVTETDGEEMASRSRTREDEPMLFEHWGATPEEISGPVAGDDLCPEARTVATRCITVPAPPADVFPWIGQMGFGRAGWYSYDWIDNLGRRSAREIHPEWQNVETGSSVPGGPIAFEAALVADPRAFVLRLAGKGRLAGRIAFILAYELREVPEGTRLITRVRIHVSLPGGRLVERFILGPGDGIMVRKQLLTLAQRAAG